MKEKRLVNRFSEKNYHLGKWAILHPKIAHPHNSGSAGRIFLKFCTVKGANRQMRMIIIFPKKVLFGVNGPFWVQKWRIVISLDPLKEVFKFYTIERANRQIKVITIVCTQKNLFRKDGPFWARKWHILTTLDQLQEFFLKACKMKGANKFMKILAVFFREKN